MKVLLESTTQTTELLVSGAQDAKQKGVPARIWQGHVVEIDHAEMRTQLLDLSNTVVREANNLHPDTLESHRAALRTVVERMRDMATMLDEQKLGIDVHALITRIAHKIDEPDHVVDRFRRELQQHAAPRPEYERAYSLRMFI